MSATVDVWFDYICPYSLIARHVLADALADTGAEVHWHPFEVNPDCIEEAGEYPRGVWENSVRPLGERNGVRLPGPPATPLRRARLAFAGYQYALEQGAGDRYSELLFRAYFHQWQDISDPVVLTGLAADAGLDPAGYRRAIMAGRHARLHQEADGRARREAAVTMVPVVKIGAWRADGVPLREDVAAAFRAAALDAAA